MFDEKRVYDELQFAADQLRSTLLLLIHFAFIRAAACNLVLEPLGCVAALESATKGESAKQSYLFIVQTVHQLEPN